MSSLLNGTAGYLVALLTSGLCLYFWRRVLALGTEMQTLEQKLAVRVNDPIHTKVRKPAPNEELRKKDKELANKVREIIELEKVRSDLTRQCAEVQSALQDNERVLSKERDHYATQTESLLAQLRELDREHSLMKKTYESGATEKSKEQERIMHGLESENQRLQEQLKHAENSVKHLQMRLMEIQHCRSEDMANLKNMQHKSQQSDHLYKTIRGQKEMLEERLVNWERALNLLSVWVLQETGKSNSLVAGAKLGELVTAALQASQQGQLLTETELRQEESALSV